MLRIRAGRVYPVTAPPIEDGAVLVGDDGVISAVGRHSRVPIPPGTEALEFPDAALVPGLVNCHTHLELTHLAGKNGEREFHRWIHRVRELKQATSPDEFLAAAEQGVRDGWAAGVTCVADTGDSGAPARALARLGGRGIYYQEVFGPDPGQCDDSLAGLRAALDRLSGFPSDRLAIGVSPHAPYSVSAPLYRAVAAYARAERLPLAVHVAESREEVALLRDGSGPFGDMWRRRGIVVAAPNESPIAYLSRLGVLASGCLCIHCVQVDAADIGRLRTDNAAVVHCPLSNRAHGHGAAPYGDLLAAGVRVGIGTDSVVSVGALDLWAETAAAGLGAKAALHAVTIDGARALCLERQVGSLEVGKQGDVAVLSDFPTVRPPGRPTALLTAVAGRIVHRIA